MFLSYITVLSNWIVGYDKYNKIYSKTKIAESTYPNEFYLLNEQEFIIGINKATNLLKKINSNNNLLISSNKIIRIETNLTEADAKKNVRNGLGWVIEQNWVNVAKVYIYENNSWINITIEDLTALAYKINDKSLKEYFELKPRTLSILPVALACQANCKFCFSESSISFDQKRSLIDFENLESICKKAYENGAERFVITGGGEPALLKFESLIKVIAIAKKYFDKIVLISNGLFLSENNESIIIDKVNKLISAGLSVLSFSYHHYNEEKNDYIMGRSVKTDYLLKTLINNKINEKITLRLICVLQNEGVNSSLEIQKYIDYALKNKIHQICFKELYISSSSESLYSGQKENKYSEDNQVSLKILINYLDLTSTKIAELPWGSPVYRYNNEIDIAAYTEPSVGWERSNGIARSWNILADGKFYASLEDKNSILEI